MKVCKLDYTRPNESMEIDFVAMLEPAVYSIFTTLFIPSMTQMVALLIEWLDFRL